MAPNSLGNSSKNSMVHHKPSRLSFENLQRTVSDISFQLNELLTREEKESESAASKVLTLPPVSEIEDAKCECCGMSEEFTPEYIKKVREKFSGKMICGLCSEAVKEEMEKNGGKREEALKEHMNACVKFNRVGRAYPVLLQAKAMGEILKKNRANSLSPREKGEGVGLQKKGGIARSSSCIPAIIKEINTDNMVK
ncbi:uncharacterized protein LOC111377065 [Olea europaea var. sylvestris]|uniref:DUF1677 family protein n=1 Tax=Olea europaea subsp. europaea TaxID=158383 RepID=A0A8S0PJR8_OLEEU|nr:uncharacterized protein LOC111377065 [Olea europaea var. sylvestris]CAA2953762.1 Hypothetical predicted protein [Olea europaea subsp. europaea]